MPLTLPYPQSGGNPVAIITSRGDFRFQALFRQLLAHCFHSLITVRAEFELQIPLSLAVLQSTRCNPL
jgi:hypothetical protein